MKMLFTTLIQKASFLENILRLVCVSVHLNKTFTVKNIFCTLFFLLFIIFCLLLVSHGCRLTITMTKVDKTELSDPAILSNNSRPIRGRNYLTDWPTRDYNRLEKEKARESWPKLQKNSLKMTQGNFDNQSQMV